MQVIDTLTWPGFILWTVLSLFFGALLGELGKRVGVDFYSMLTERIKQRQIGATLTDSELERLQSKLSHDLGELSKKAGSVGTIHEAIPNWRRMRDTYVSTVRDDLRLFETELETRHVEASELGRSIGLLERKLNKFAEYQGAIDEKDCSLDDYLKPPLGSALWQEDPDGLRNTEFNQDLNDLGTFPKEVASIIRGVSPSA